MSDLTGMFQNMLTQRYDPMAQFTATMSKQMLRDGDITGQRATLQLDEDKLGFVNSLRDAIRKEKQYAVDAGVEPDMDYIDGLNRLILKHSS